MHHENSHFVRASVPSKTDVCYSTIISTTKKPCDDTNSIWTTKMFLWLQLMGNLFLELVKSCNYHRGDERRARNRECYCKNTSWYITTPQGLSSFVNHVYGGTQLGFSSWRYRRKFLSQVQEYGRDGSIWPRKGIKTRLSTAKIWQTSKATERRTEKASLLRAGRAWMQRSFLRAVTNPAINTSPSA